MRLWYEHHCLPIVMDNGLKICRGPLHRMSIDPRQPQCSGTAEIQPQTHERVSLGLGVRLFGLSMQLLSVNRRTSRVSTRDVQFSYLLLALCREGPLSRWAHPTTG
jgi:hypothetical protein